MPNYDYHCNACNHEFIVERSMSDTSEVKCETCSANDTRRVWSAVVIGGSSAKKGAEAPKPQTGGGGHGRCGPSCC